MAELYSTVWICHTLLICSLVTDIWVVSFTKPALYVIHQSQKQVSEKEKNSQTQEDRRPNSQIPVFKIRTWG